MFRKDDWFSWSPFDEVALLHSAIDRLFGDSFSGSQNVRFSQPKVDMYEKDENLVVEAELPGIEEKDVNIEVSEDAIKIEGEKKGEVEVKSENYYRKESHLGNFSRVLSFPFTVQPDKAKATFKNGELTVTIPKSAEAKKKVIKIKPE
jgi:HSP20 family protein